MRISENALSARKEKRRRLWQTRGKDDLLDPKRGQNQKKEQWQLGGKIRKVRKSKQSPAGRRSLNSAGKRRDESERGERGLGGEERGYVANGEGPLESEQ